MVNNEAGAFLNITPDVLKKLDSFDEKLEKIEKHAHTAADALKNGFGSVVMDTSKLENAITSLASKIGALNNAGKAFDNISTSAQHSNAQVGEISSSISDMAQMLNRLKFPTFSMGDFSPENVAKMREALSLINSKLKSGNISSDESYNLSKKKIEYEEQLKAYQSFINTKNKIAANANAEELRQQQSTYRKMSNVMESYMKKVEEQKQRYENAMKSMADYAAQSPGQRASAINNTLSFSANAKTLQDDVAAIKLLKEARLQLDKTDKNYQATLNQINSAIAKHNQALTEAGVKSQQLVRHQSNLMDTAGQLKRALALVFSVSQIQGYINSIAKVRGEFELQQRSLQAILQNRTKADTVFNKTMALALDSPFRAQQLITYTKQLAAYRIESDKLYDTTKRLADVSAGLGVDMQRLILAYGQVKAAAYLRGSEVRQFTEAGINMYGELQRYFEEIKGEAYTTAQIVDMISKRKVTFEDVENIFKRLTDEGGIFYNMQHIQVETLAGKIGKLRDAIDQMKNSIGKENEGIFKGSIDAATVLVQNWDKVVNAGYALAGVFLMLKTQSISTGVAMSKVFTAEFASRSRYALKPMELLKIKFWDLQKGAINLGKSLKAAFVTNLPLLAITAIASAAYKAYDKINSYNDSVSKANEELVKARGAVADLANEYKNLETATNKAKQVQERNNDPTTDIKARRNALQKLIDLANKEGLTFEVKVSEVKEEELDAVFNGIKEQYERFLLDMAIIEKNHAENKRNRDWWFFSDAINEDADDYRNAVLDILAQSDKVDMAIANVKTNYDNLSESSKKYYNIIAAGKKDGESQIDYYTRMYNAMLQINRLNVGTNTGVPQWLKGTNTILKDVSGNFKDVGRQAKKFEEELDNVLGEVIANARKNGSTDIQIQARIDKYAARQGFDDIKKDLAYQHFGINISINQDSVDKETSWVDNYLKKFFEKKTYKINLDMTQPIDAKVPFEDFIKKGDEAAKAAKSWEEVEKRIAAVGKNAKQIEADSSIANFLNSQNSVLNIKSGDMVDVKLILDTISEYKKTQTDLSNALGVNPFAKAERGILSERISVLKEMQSRYEKLNQLMGENAAIEQTLSAFKPALKFTGMDEMNILPTKEGMIKAYEELLKDVTDRKKITELKKIIAELKIEIQEEDLKNQLEKTKKNIEDMFNGLDLHKKLKDAGLSEAEVRALFPGLAKTLDDVEKGIEEEFNKLRDVNGQLGKTEQKDYEDRIAKLNQQRIKESQDLVVELTKNYKTQLSDQMQLDTWYIKERSKIYSKAYDEQTKTFKDVLTPEMQKQYEANLNKEYQKRTSENTWKNFQATDFYIDMFENLDRASTASIKGMLERLQDLRSSLKDLPADQVRAIINQMEKLQETIVSRNPFKTFGESIKAYNEALLELKKVDEYGNLTNESTTYEELEKSQSENAKKLADIEAQKNAENSKLEVLKQQKAEGELYHTLSKKELDDLEKKIADQQKLTDELILQAEIQGKITKAEADQLRNVRNLKKLSEMSAEEIVNGIGNTLSQIGSELPNIASNLENVFGTMSDGLKDTIDTLSEVTSGLGSAANGIGQIMTANGNPFQIISGGLQAIGGITKAIGALFAIGDKKKEREIQRQIENVEKLQKAYEGLKEKMDAAWESADLHKQTKDTIANLDDQIASYKAMIKAEEDKKKTDKERIEEWQEAIEDLQKTKQEIMQQEQMDLGGIGGESEYKSAAENFVQAWMDAFNETGKGIEGLKESFDDMIENLVVKQATMRLAQNRLKKIFDEIDKSVTEESAGGINLTKEELENINSIADSALKGLNEDLLALMETLGYKGKGKTAELSALTQSIQGITEREAEALEALLNSIRFFVATQTSDTTAIRNLLEARYGLESQNSEANPMLIELRAQTGYLEILSDRIDRVFATNANSRGAGLRVYMQ